MDKKYITFYKKFILQTKTLSDRGVSLNSELELTLLAGLDAMHYKVKGHFSPGFNVFNTTSSA